MVLLKCLDWPTIQELVKLFVHIFEQNRFRQKLGKKKMQNHLPNGTFTKPFVQYALISKRPKLLCRRQNDFELFYTRCEALSNAYNCCYAEKPDRVLHPQPLRF